MGDQQQRFEVLLDDVLTDNHGRADQVRILRDSQTGVCYVQTAWGYAGGLTPLLDSEGKPVVQH